MKKALAILLIMGSAPFANAQSKNISFGPFGLLMGAPNGRLDIPLGDQWTVGPELGYLNIDIGDFNIRASEFRLNFGLYFDGMFTDSFYLGPFLGYRVVDVSSDVENTKASVSVAGMVGGYHWFWDSFNVRLGAGISQGFGITNIKIWNNEGQTESVNIVSALSIDVGFGFTF